MFDERSVHIITADYNQFDLSIEVFIAKISWFFLQHKEIVMGTKNCFLT
jgi:hypothetical protein